ncbi:hypothetical protein D3C74_407910 [compost metagenome]
MPAQITKQSLLLHIYRFGVCCSDHITQTVSSPASVVFDRPVFIDPVQKETHLTLHCSTALPSTHSSQNGQKISQVSRCLYDLREHLCKLIRVHFGQ